MTEHPTPTQERALVPAGVKPYYIDEKAGIAIINADCRDVLPLLEPGSVDLVLTDPPYGVNYRQGADRSNPIRQRAYKRHVNVPIIGDMQPFDPSALLGFPMVILFGANNFADRLPRSRGWVFWDKKPGLLSNDFGDGELIWTNQDRVIRRIAHRWSGVCRASENGEVVLHPTQKPVALIIWLISNYAPTADIILDPFMGSGTTLVAAKMLHRHCLGIEVEERYCEVAAQRLAQEVLPL